MVMEGVFLLVLGGIWILFAVVQDIRKREIANWLNFSLVIFALGFRFFYSLFSSDNFAFFVQGIIGFGIFLVLGNLLYYGKVFAGGDAKLMIGLGAVLPFSDIFTININTFLVFFVFFLIAGAFYGIIMSVSLGIGNKKAFVKEFSREFRESKNYFNFSLMGGIVLVVLAFFLEPFLFYMGILVALSPYVYFSAKSIDEGCMIKKVNAKELTEGDWLYKDVKIGKKLIKARWSGLSKEEINFLKKKKRQVMIRQGIPFSPVFLISYIALIYVFIKGISFL